MIPTAYIDLDGCLVDSRAPIITCVDAVLSAFGLPPLSAAEAAEIIGPPIVEGFRRLLAARGDDPARATTCVEEFRTRYTGASLDLTTTVPGIDTALTALRMRAALVVVTSKPRDLALPILEKLRLLERFEGVFGPGRDALDETKPTTLVRARSGRAAHPADAMIGDRHHDIAAGRACGVRAIGVAWGIGSIAELRDAGADVVIERPDELAGLFS